MRSRTLMTQNQVLQFCSEQQAGFSLVFEEKEARVKLTVVMKTRFRGLFPANQKFKKNFLCVFCTVRKSSASNSLRNSWRGKNVLRWGIGAKGD